jgi:predicted RNase H-like HicB family nuclease
MNTNGHENAEHGVLPQIVSPLTLLCMKLRLVLEHDSETNRWAAFFPELPGCASVGDSEEEAVRNAKEALELWVESSISIWATHLFAKNCLEERVLSPPANSNCYLIW